MSEHRLPVPVAPLTPAEIAAVMATGHSVFGPSGAEMTMTCEASLALNAKADDHPSYEAAEGTVAHALSEEWIKTGKRPSDQVGEIEIVNGYEIEITEEMLAYCEDFVDGCFEAAEEADESFSERQVDISDLTPIPNQGGTLDFGAMSWQHLRIIDLKYGKEPVYAFYPDEGKINKQLAIYAYGVFLEFDWLYNFQTISLEICQPRLPHVWSRHTITRAELLEFADYARERWALAWRIDAPRTPSLRGCRWCKVRATCPALYLFMAEDLDDAFDAFDDDGVIETGTDLVSYSNDQMAGANETILDEFEPSPFPKLPKPPELSTAALAKLLRYRKFMENFFNAVSEELLSRAISNEETIPWWKLVESRTQRRLVDDEEYVAETLATLGLKKADLYSRKMKSPAQIEETLHTKLKMSKRDAKAFLEEHGLTVKPPGRQTLAPTTDSRMELPKDSDAFDVWNDEDI